MLANNVKIISLLNMPNVPSALPNVKTSGLDNNIIPD